MGLFKMKRIAQPQDLVGATSIRPGDGCLLVVTGASLEKRYQPGAKKADVRTELYVVIDAAPDVVGWCTSRNIIYGLSGIDARKEDVTCISRAKEFVYHIVPVEKVLVVYDHTVGSEEIINPKKWAKRLAQFPDMKHPRRR